MQESQKIITVITLRLDWIRDRVGQVLDGEGHGEGRGEGHVEGRGEGRGEEQQQCSVAKRWICSKRWVTSSAGRTGTE